MLLLVCSKPELWANTGVHTAPSARHYFSVSSCHSQLCEDRQQRRVNRFAGFYPFVVWSRCAVWIAQRFTPDDNAGHNAVAVFTNSIHAFNKPSHQRSSDVTSTLVWPGLLIYDDTLSNYVAVFYYDDSWLQTGVRLLFWQYRMRNNKTLKRKFVCKGGAFGDRLSTWQWICFAVMTGGRWRWPSVPDNVVWTDTVVK